MTQQINTISIGSPFASMSQVQWWKYQIMQGIDAMDDKVIERWVRRKEVEFDLVIIDESKEGHKQ